MTQGKRDPLILNAISERRRQPLESRRSGFLNAIRSQRRAGDNIMPSATVALSQVS
jgi:hypothetical protein